MSAHHDWWGYIKAIIRRYPSRKDRLVSGVAACEKEAVRAAVEATDTMRDGRERLKVIELVYWKRSHTLEGAAMQVPCSYSTVKRWQQRFIEEVASNFKCDALLQKDEPKTPK